MQTIQQFLARARPVRCVMRGGHQNGQGPRTCESGGCLKSTREGKPFCPDHVDQHPYVQILLQQLADQDAEQDKVKKKGAAGVNLGGLTANELLLHLHWHGPRTYERLAQELKMELKVVFAYAKALKRCGLVKLGWTTRGSRTVAVMKEQA